jgi:hypothetical protein
MKIYTPLNIKKGNIEVTKILLRCDCGNIIKINQNGRTPRLIHI